MQSPWFALQELMNPGFRRGTRSGWKGLTIGWEGGQGSRGCIITDRDESCQGVSTRPGRHVVPSEGRVSAQALAVFFSTHKVDFCTSAFWGGDAEAPGDKLLAHSHGLFPGPLPSLLTMTPSPHHGFSPEVISNLVTVSHMQINHCGVSWDVSSQGQGCRRP